MIITPEEAQKKLRVQADRAFRALILEASSRIIKRTPVDTGRARGNWQASVDNLSVEEFDEDKNGAMTILGVKSDTAKVDIDNVVYLLNGLPYIKRLEYEGWSKQAPAGMVRVTLAELGELAKKVAAKVRAAQ